MFYWYFFYDKQLPKLLSFNSYRVKIKAIYLFIEMSSGSGFYGIFISQLVPEHGTRDRTYIEFSVTGVRKQKKFQTIVVTIAQEVLT